MRSWNRWGTDASLLLVRDTLFAVNNIDPNFSFVCELDLVTPSILQAAWNHMVKVSLIQFDFALKPNRQQFCGIIHRNRSVLIGSRLHISGTTKDLLEKTGSFEVLPRGQIYIKVRYLH